MFLFAISIFLSAFLLFQIQPMIGKFILPWFGGTPAVWSTVMLFFQILLTGGYAYAYWLIERVQPRHQFIVHTSLIAFAFLSLIMLSTVWESPVTPDAGWKPQNIRSPVFDIFKLLAISVGLSYFILAANGPLMQAWFSRMFPERTYARLYALSNLGSLLGLLAYPILIEPSLPLRWQGWAWALGFFLFGWIAIQIASQSRGASERAQPEWDPARSIESQTAGVVEARSSLALKALWILLSATASLFLLSVTNQITQEVAVIPFLWVLPLALYLLSFILTFSGERGYHRKLFIVLFTLSVVFTLYVMLHATSTHIYWQILAYCLLLFSACMICHGELYLLRPPAHSLTTFYLMVSIGGAFGGIFVSLIAPVIFNGYWEFFVGLGTTIAITLTILRSERSRDAHKNVRSPSSTDHLTSRARFIFTTFCLVTLMLAGISTFFSGALYSERNFYGVIRVNELFPDGSTHRAYEMSHGITVHGLQFVEPELHDQPTTYYVPESGAGLAILNHPRYGQKMRVGLLGLGVGTLVTYAQPGDEYRLYEINPAVTELAAGKGGYFSFLRDSPAKITMVLGDARISLERELEEGSLQNFDVLVLDTFSSDSIPVHLVTKEAFALYLAHLAPDGIIAAHITNLHLDLQPVFWQLAQHYGLTMMRINYEGDSNGGFASHWILLSRDPALLENSVIRKHSIDLDDYSTQLQLWTDDYSNLFQILK
jgi:MFS family permease